MNDGQKRYLVGLGNYAKNDDGIGLRIVEYIAERNLDKGFSAVEIGNDGMKLLTYFNPTTAKILIADCALMGEEPGYYRIFDPCEVRSRKSSEAISTHEGDVLKIIQLAKQLDYPIPEIRVLAVEPESLGMDMRLSDTLAERLEEYVQTAIDELR